jgi:hypothetical protein
LARNDANGARGSSVPCDSLKASILLSFSRALLFATKRMSSVAQYARAIANADKHVENASINHVEKFSRGRLQTDFARSVSIGIERIASK